MSEWTMDKVILEPKRAATLLNELEGLRMQANRRIGDLLAANNRYLQDGRDARRQVRALEEELRILRFALRTRH